MTSSMSNIYKVCFTQQVCIVVACDIFVYVVVVVVYISFAV